jgi:integrase/recombinase XerD
MANTLGRGARWRMKLSKAIAEFVADNRARLAPATLRGYESDFHALQALVSIDSVLGVTPDIISLYFQVCSGKNQKPATLHRKAASLGEFCRWGVRKGLWARDPMREFPGIPKPQRVPRPFTPDEMARLMALDLDPLERTVRQVLAYSGLRVSPVCALRVGDVSFSAELLEGVAVPGAIRSAGKGNKPHVIPMAPSLHAVLYDWVLQHTDLKPQSPLFRQRRADRPIHRRIVEDWCHRWGEQAGVPHCIPHRFRHTVATTLLQAGTKIEVVQRILAHADIKDTLLYCKLADDAAAAAMFRLPADWTQVRPPASLGPPSGGASSGERR